MWREKRRLRNPNLTVNPCETLAVTRWAAGSQKKQVGSKAKYFKVTTLCSMPASGHRLPLLNPHRRGRDQLRKQLPWASPIQAVVLPCFKTGLRSAVLRGRARSRPSDSRIPRPSKVFVLVLP